MRKIPIVIGVVTTLCLCFQIFESNNSKPTSGLHYDDAIHYGRNSFAKIEIANHINRMMRSKKGDEESYSESNLTQEFLRLKSASSRMARKQEDLDWQERGPGNVGGRARAFIVDQNDDTGDTWLIGTAGGGIWKTTDQGIKWTNTSEGIPNLSIVAIAQSASDPQIIYAGTGENGLGGATSNGSGMLKSTDGGSTWQILSATAIANVSDFLNVNDIVVDPEDADIVYAATSSGRYGQEFTSAVMKSTDGGESWTKLYTPEGAAQQLEADPENFSTLYVSVRGSGIAKSTDGGDSWELTSLYDLAEKFSPDRTAFSISPANTDIIYASIGYSGRAGSGLFFTTDGGDTWNMAQGSSDVDFLVQGEYDNCIAAYPDDESKVIWGGVELWTGTLDFETTITGNTFIGADISEVEDFFELVSFNNGSHYSARLAVVDARNTPSIEIRFGSGESQKAHRFTVPEGSTSGVPDNSYSYQDYVNVPFEVWDTDNNQQLMVSFRDQEDDGEFSLNFPKDEALSNSREYIYVHNIDYNASSASDDIAKAGGQEAEQYLFMWPKLVLNAEWNDGDVPDGVFSISFGEVEYVKSEIFNASEGNQFLHPDHHYLEFFSTDGGDRLISANDGGMAVSLDNGESIGNRNRGLSITQFYSATKKPGEQVYLGGTQDNDVVLSPADPNGSSTWAEQHSAALADGFEVVFHPNNPDVMLASYQLNNVIKSTDGGTNWDFSTSGLIDAGFNNNEAPFHTKLGHSKNNPSAVFAVSKSGVWRSSNFGDSWNLYTIKESKGWGGFYDVEVSDADPAIVWAGGAMDDSRNLFVSTDYGATFNKVKNYKLLPDLGNITTIVPDPNDAETVYVTMSRAGEPKILRSTDLGENWEDISGFDDNGESDNGFPDLATMCVLPFPDGKTIWAGTELGLFESTDNGKSWHEADNGFPYVFIWDLKVVDGEVVVATHGRGIWSVDLDLEYPDQKVLAVEDVNESYTSVYPSPASSVLKFRFADNKPAKNIRLLNINGQLMHETQLRTGEVEKSIEISQFDRGMYIVRVVYAEGISEQYKVIFN